MNAANRRRWMFRAVFLVLLLAIGTMGVACKDGNDAKPDHQGASQPAVVYTCTMHPQIRESKPGKCPICKMDLVPAKQTESSEGK